MNIKKTSTHSVRVAVSLLIRERFDAALEYSFAHSDMHSRQALRDSGQHQTVLHIPNFQHLHLRAHIKARSPEANPPPSMCTGMFNGLETRPLTVLGL